MLHVGRGHAVRTTPGKYNPNLVQYGRLATPIGHQPDRNRKRQGPAAQLVATGRALWWREKTTLGASGTIAKRNNIDCSYLQVTLEDGHAYTRGQGGTSWIAVQKDRHGQVRAYSPTGDKEPTAARFVMRESEDGAIGFELRHRPRASAVLLSGPILTSSSASPRTLTWTTSPHEMRAPSWDAGWIRSAPP